MDNVEKIKSLTDQSSRIRAFFKKWNELCDDSACDKKGFGFNIDGRFSACEPIKISIDSYCGWYGNSGCCAIFGSLDHGIIQRHFIAELNSQFAVIMGAVATRIDNEAATLTIDALKEVEELKSSIEKLAKPQ